MKTPQRTRIEGLLYRIFDNRYSFQTLANWLPNSLEDQEFYKRALAYAWTRRFRTIIRPDHLPPLESTLSELNLTILQAFPVEDRSELWFKLIELLVEQIPQDELELVNEMIISRQVPSVYDDRPISGANTAAPTSDLPFSVKAVRYLKEKKDLIAELETKDQQIQRIQAAPAHAEFLDTQLDFYKLAKPDLWREFEASNPSSLDIGNLLNFLEAKLTAKEGNLNTLKNQQKTFLQEQIQLIETHLK